MNRKSEELEEFEDEPPGLRWRAWSRLFEINPRAAQSPEELLKSLDVVADGLGRLRDIILKLDKAEHPKVRQLYQSQIEDGVLQLQSFAEQMALARDEITARGGKRGRHSPPLDVECEVAFLLGYVHAAGLPLYGNNELSRRPSACDTVAGVLAELRAQSLDGELAQKVPATADALQRIAKAARTGANPGASQKQQMLTRALERGGDDWHRRGRKFGN